MVDIRWLLFVFLHEKLGMFTKDYQGIMDIGWFLDNMGMFYIGRVPHKWRGHEDNPFGILGFATGASGSGMSSAFRQ